MSGEKIYVFLPKIDKNIYFLKWKMLNFIFIVVLSFLGINIISVKYYSVVCLIAILLIQINSELTIFGVLKKSFKYFSDKQLFIRK